MLPPGDEFLDSRLPFPILEAALINKCKKFVAHDYSQETLREKLVHSDVNDDILPWNSTSQTFQYLYILMSLILMPIFVICKVLQDIAQLCRKGSKNNASQSEGRKPRLRFLYSFFSFPLNRSIGYLYSIILQFVFVLLWITGLDVMVWFVWIISLAGLIALLKKFWLVKLIFCININIWLNRNLKSQFKRNKFHFLCSCLTNFCFFIGATLKLINVFIEYLRLNDILGEVDGDPLHNTLTHCEIGFNSVGEKFRFCPSYFIVLLQELSLFSWDLFNFSSWIPSWVLLLPGWQGWAGMFLWFLGPGLSSTLALYLEFILF